MVSKLRSASASPCGGTLAQIKQSFTVIKFIIADVSPVGAPLIVTMSSMLYTEATFIRNWAEINEGGRMRQKRDVREKELEQPSVFYPTVYSTVRVSGRAHSPEWAVSRSLYAEREKKDSLRLTAPAGDWLARCCCCGRCSVVCRLVNSKWGSARDWRAFGSRTVSMAFAALRLSTSQRPLDTLTIMTFDIPYSYLIAVRAGS